MLKSTLCALSLGLVCTALPAQTCASLTVTGNGAPGTTLSFALDGSTAGAYAILAIGDTQGSTTLNFGSLASVTLGLATPFAAVPMGVADGNGDVTLSLQIPANVTLPSMDLFAQGVLATITRPGGGPGGGGPGGGLSLCVSNVAAFHVGP